VVIDVGEGSRVATDRMIQDSRMEVDVDKLGQFKRLGTQSELEFNKAGSKQCENRRRMESRNAFGAVVGEDLGIGRVASMPMAAKPMRMM
jgi:hypothetical protein